MAGQWAAPDIRDNGTLAESKVQVISEYFFTSEMLQVAVCSVACV